jgi:hypothetical protein
MSEGAPRQETDGAMYYGMTSILLPLASAGGPIPDEHAPDIIRALTADPHARLRAVRIACLEAQLRAGGPIGRVRAELLVRSDARGVRIDVEVEARVFADGTRSAPGPRKAPAPLPPQKKRSTKK